jgi:hypothetical protein
MNRDGSVGIVTRLAIPSLSGFHTEGPPSTGIFVTLCSTLPEAQAVSSQAGIRVTAVHSVGRAATIYEFLLSYRYGELAPSVSLGGAVAQ